MRVSSIISACGMVDATWFTRESGERGNAVHWLLEAVLLGQEVLPADELAGFLLGIRRGLATLSSLVPMQVEQRITANGISGRPDVVGYLDAPHGRIPAGPTIIDGKSGMHLPSHGVQLAFYELLAETTGLRDKMPKVHRSRPWNLLGLYVGDDGSYKVKVFGEPEDREAMHATIVLTRWRVMNGLLSSEALAVRGPDPAPPPLLEEA